MGHTRLGEIPKSQKWTAVVESISGGSNAAVTGGDLSSHVSDIAKQTIEAAEGGLKAAINDAGLQYTFYLLTQIALASRSDDWLQRLRQHGIRLSPNDSISDLTSELHAAIDDYVFRRGRSSDIGEIAQRAAGETLAELTQTKAVTLFSADANDLRLAVRDLSTKKGFSDLSQKFFGSFVARFLNFYLSRITATHLGSANLHHLGDINKFDDALRLHCYESARIVHNFSGEWYSKTEYVEGIDLENTSGFIAIAIRKLQAELRHQEDES